MLRFDKATYNSLPFNFIILETLVTACEIRCFTISRFHKYSIDYVL